MEAIHREEALMDEIDTSREHQANTEAQLKDVSLQLSQYKKYRHYSSPPLTLC